MKHSNRTQDEALCDMHERYIQELTESGQPLWLTQLYGFGPLCINTFPMFSINEEVGETIPDPDEYDHCECGNIIPLGESYCSSKCYMGGDTTDLPGEINRNIEDDDLPF